MSSPGGRAVAELLELTRIRILLFLREPEAVFWVIVFPIILAVVLGWAFSGDDVDRSRIGLLEAEKDALAARLEERDDLEILTFRDEAAAVVKLRKGAIDALVRSGTPPSIRFDDARPEGVMARLRLRDVLVPGRPAQEDAEALREVREKDTGFRYVDFLFPGLLGMNIMGTGIWGIGYALADTRQKKLLKRLLVTPMRRSSFLLSFVLSRLVFLIGEVVILGLFAVFALGVPMEGSVAALVLISTLGGLAFSGLGLLVAARARTLEGASGLMNLVMMPMWLCSGVFFSYERFPEVFHPLFRALPLTALNDALRAVMLDGEGLGDVLPQIANQLFWGALCFFVTLRIFRWR